MKKRKKKCMIISFSVAVILIVSAVGYFVGQRINRYIREEYHTPYRGRFEWAEILDEWSDNELPLGTMEEYLQETEKLRIHTEEMTVYDKNEIVSYLEESRFTIQMPSGLTYPGPMNKNLLELHKDWPIEVILRDPEGSYPYYAGKPNINVIYKVRDEEGNIEYMYVLFEDNNGLSRFSESTNEYGTDESEQTIWRRREENKEDWRLLNYGGYYFSTSLEIGS